MAMLNNLKTNWSQKVHKKNVTPHPQKKLDHLNLLQGLLNATIIMRQKSQHIFMHLQIDRRPASGGPNFNVDFALAPNFNPTLRVHPLERDFPPTFLRFRENANYDFSPQNIRAGQGSHLSRIRWHKKGHEKA